MSPTRRIAFNLLPSDEQEDFVASCRRWRKSPDEFEVFADEEVPEPGLPAPLRRTVVAIHIPTAKARRYEAGHGSNWNAAFEEDLQALYFSSPFERFEGSGTVTPEGGSVQPVPVEFSFLIQQIRSPARPGLPPPPPRLVGRGTVTAAGGVRFPEGFYRLRTPSGQEQRVQKLGTEWHMLAPLV